MYLIKHLWCYCISVLFAAVLVIPTIYFDQFFDDGLRSTVMTIFFMVAIFTFAGIAMGFIPYMICLGILYFEEVESPIFYIIFSLIVGNICFFVFLSDDKTLTKMQVMMLSTVIPILTGVLYYKLDNTINNHCKNVPNK